MQKIKRKDKVVVIAGKDRGKEGSILRILKPTIILSGRKTKKYKGTRVVVEGINMVKKHVKPNPSKNTQGGIVKSEAAICISNIALLNATTGKPDKVGFKVLKDGKKVRYFKSNDEVIDE